MDFKKIFIACHCEARSNLKLSSTLDCFAEKARNDGDTP